jgi:hypothetical protein
LNHLPTIAEIDGIAAQSDPVIRNLHITQSYRELSSTFAARTGPVANWCTFATWASKQAGQTIRKEDLLRTLEQVLANAADINEMLGRVSDLIRGENTGHSVDQIRQLVWDALGPRAAMERASDAVGRGNQKVFAEIGHEFARFAAECLGDTAPDAEKIARFCTGLKPGDPPDGQRYLHSAFTCYYRALFETDAKTRVELLLLANLQIGFHEQTRLQPEIAEALEASVVDPYVFSRRLVDALFPNRGWMIHGVWWVMRQLGFPSKLDTAINRFFMAVRHRIRLLLTDYMMVLELPVGRMRLGDDLRAGYPETLRRLTNPELVALLHEIDPTTDSLRDSGAADWADLPDRIHYIADLFRCYGESPELLNPPFTDDQVAAFRAGRLPEGPL